MSIVDPNGFAWCLSVWLYTSAIRHILLDLILKSSHYSLKVQRGNNISCSFGGRGYWDYCTSLYPHIGVMARPFDCDCCVRPAPMVWIGNGILGDDWTPRVFVKRVGARIWVICHVAETGRNVISDSGHDNDLRTVGYLTTWMEWPRNWDKHVGLNSTTWCISSRPRDLKHHLGW